MGLSRKHRKGRALAWKLGLYVWKWQFNEVEVDFLGLVYLE